MEAPHDKRDLINPKTRDLVVFSNKPPFPVITTEPTLSLMSECAYPKRAPTRAFSSTLWLIAAPPVHRSVDHSPIGVDDHRRHDGRRRCAGLLAR